MRFVRGLVSLIPANRRRRLARPAFLGTLRRLTPVSEQWGADRGTPVDRHYIEEFLARHRGDVRGAVLEVKDAWYTQLFGTDVVRSDVLDIDAANPEATIVADLAAADSIPNGTYDCVVLTQTLQYIADVHAAARHVHRILKPGGVALVTVPAVSRVVCEAGLTDYWRFTAAGCRSVFEPLFGTDAVEVETCGNVLASIAFLSGMASEELKAHELAACDERYPVIVCVRAVRAHPGRAT